MINNKIRKLFNRQKTAAHQYPRRF